MYSDSFLEILRDRLDPQPSVEAPPGDRLAGVCLLLAGDDEPSIVLTKRTDDLSRHAGEISFPGGIEHKEDPDLASTALRELQEELGVHAGDVAVLGALTPVHTHVSGILVVPFVGVLEPGSAAFTPNPGEIASVIQVPVAELTRIEARVEMQRRGVRFHTYVYETHGHSIWGATGHMLHEFLDLVRSVDAS